LSLKFIDTHRLKAIFIKTAKKIFSLEHNFVLLTFIIISVSLLITDFLISSKVHENTYQHLYIKADDIAHMVADSPIVIDGLSGKEPPEKIQQFADNISEIDEIRFVVVLGMDGKRYSHPDEAMIDTYYDNTDGEEAFQGKEISSVSKGSLGESMRKFIPVYNKNNEQIGVVLVGIMLDTAEDNATENKLPILYGSICGLLTGLIFAGFMAKHIKKSTFGLEPFAVARLLEERNAILTAIREGSFAIDKDARIQTINPAARSLFAEAGIKGDGIGEKVDDFVPNSRMVQVLESGIAELDQEQDLNGLTILTNRVPIYVNNEIVGVVATFRDKSELQKLAEKLMDVSTYAEALRAQTHEFMNKMHVVLGMIQLQCYDQLQEYIRQIAYKYQSETGAIIKNIKDPVLAGFLLGKLSWAHEAGVEMKLSETSFLPNTIDASILHDVITILGSLLNNAVEAVENSSVKKVELSISQADGNLQIIVSDTGSGIPKENDLLIYQNAYSTKSKNRGIGLYQTKQLLSKYHGNITFSSQTDKGTTFYVNMPYSDGK